MKRVKQAVVVRGGDLAAFDADLSTNTEFHQLSESRVTITVAYQVDVSNSFRYEKWLFEDFYSHFVHLPRPERYYHEMITGEEPCRVYFDLEWKWTPMLTSSEWLGLVNELDCLVRKTSSCTSSSPPPLVWNAHRSDRWSSHVYYDSWLEHAYDMKLIVNRLIEYGASPNLVKILDAAVYPSASGVRKPFRMPYSSKYSEAAREVLYPLIPSSDDGTDPFGHGPFQKELFCKSMVTCHRKTAAASSDIEQLLPLVTEFVKFDEEERKAVVGGASFKYCEESFFETSDQLDAFKAWVKENLSVKRVYQGKTPNTYIFYPGVYCPAHKGRHSSNNTLVSLSKRGTTKYFCPKCSVSWDAMIAWRRFTKYNNNPTLTL